MINGEIFSSVVTSLAANGAGVTHVKGQAIFVEQTVPGDTITAQAREAHGRWAKADLLEISAPGPDRVEPVCPEYGQCGGCAWQHIAYPAQVREKRTLLTEALRRIGGLGTLPNISVYPSPPYGYRSRVQFFSFLDQFFSPKDAKAKNPAQNSFSKDAKVKKIAQKGSLVGFKAKKSAEKIPITDCPIADHGIRRALQEQQIQVPPEKDRFTVFSWKNLFLNESNLQRGTLFLKGRELLIDVKVFFQANVLLLEQVIAAVLGFAASADPSAAADIYAGVGTFGAFLKDQFQRIDIIEENKAALSLARENLRGASADFAALPADQWAKSHATGHKDYGFVLADPPRQGLSPGLREWLVRSGPGRLAYLSCDAPTFARDAGALVRGGYTLEALSLYDFYPQTPHIETLGFFTNFSKKGRTGA